MRNTYLIQPYEVGAKNAKSLAVVIPSAIAKKYSIDTSTGFVMKHDNSKIVLHFMDMNKKDIPVETSFEAPSTGIDQRR